MSEFKYVPKSGDISIFTNKKKETEKHPLLTGKALLNINELKKFADENGDITMYVSLWGKVGNGGTFWAGKISPPRDQSTEFSNNLPPGTDFAPEPAKATGAEAFQNEGGPDDDLPF